MGMEMRLMSRQGESQDPDQMDQATHRNMSKPGLNLTPLAAGWRSLSGEGREGQQGGDGGISLPREMMVPRIKVVPMG